MELGKKGILLSVLALLISSILIATFALYQKMPLDEDYTHINYKIKTSNNYLQDLDTYISRELALAIREGITNIVLAMEERENYVDDASEEINNCILKGEYYIGPYNHTCYITKSEITDKYESFAEQSYNIDIEIDITDLTMTDSESPWHLKGTYNYSVVLKDSYAFWNITEEKEFFVPITRLKEPLSMISSRPSISIMSNADGINEGHNITPAKDQPFWREDFEPITFGKTPLGIDELVRDYADRNVTFFEYEYGPSFLTRMENKTTPGGAAGFATLVHPDDLILSESDSLDYNYFTNFNVSEHIDSTEDPYYLINFTRIESDTTLMNQLKVVVDEGIDGAILNRSIIDRVSINTSNGYIQSIN